MKTKYIYPLVIGFSSLILQIALIRAALRTFSGNELVIGIVLSVWLIGVALGSMIGRRISIKSAFGLTFLLVGVLAEPTFGLLHGLRNFLSFAPGEVIPLKETLIWSFISIFPISTIIGAQFPLAIDYIEAHSGRVYGLESAGAFLGGCLFTFVLSERIPTGTTVAMMSVLNIFAALFVLRLRILLPVLILPLVFHTVLMPYITDTYPEGMQIIRRVESRYGEIEAVKYKKQINIYHSGKFLSSYPDPVTEELLPHLTMSIRPEAEKILLIGGSMAAVREFLRYPIKNITYIEIDPQLIDVFFNILDRHDRAMLDDDRVSIISADARHFIKSQQENEYDLIVLNLPEPTTANLNRFYTMEFFWQTRKVLSSDGAIVMKLPGSSGYISDGMKRAYGAIYNSMKAIFRYVENSSSEYSIFIASDTPLNSSVQMLKENFKHSGLTTKYFNESILEDAFSPFKVELLRQRLSTFGGVNLDRRPVAYLYSLTLWSEAHGGRWLRSILGAKVSTVVILFIFPIIGIKAFLKLKKWDIHYTIFSTGLFTMSYLTILILLFQAGVGYVYEMIGLLTATYMAGGAIGAFIPFRQKQTKLFIRVLDIVLVTLLLLTPILIDREISFYILCCIAGMVGGAQFKLAGQLTTKTKQSLSGGMLYASDLLGAVLGAFVTTLILFPLSGLNGTLLTLGIIKALSLL